MGGGVNILVQLLSVIFNSISGCFCSSIPTIACSPAAISVARNATVSAVALVGRGHEEAFPDRGQQ